MRRIRRSATWKRRALEQQDKVAAREAAARAKLERARAVDAAMLAWRNGEIPMHASAAEFFRAGLSYEDIAKRMAVTRRRAVNLVWRGNNLEAVRDKARDYNQAYRDRARYGGEPARAGRKPGRHDGDGLKVTRRKRLNTRCREEKPKAIVAAEMRRDGVPLEEIAKTFGWTLDSARSACNKGRNWNNHLKQHREREHHRRARENDADQSTATGA